MGWLGSGMGVSASFQIIPRLVGRLGLELALGSQPPRRESVRVMTPSRGRELSPGGIVGGGLSPVGVVSGGMIS